MYVRLRILNRIRPFMHQYASVKTPVPVDTGARVVHGGVADEMVQIKTRVVYDEGGGK